MTGEGRPGKKAIAHDPLASLLRCAARSQTSCCSCGVMLDQPPISSIVRPHPTQTFRASSTQTLMQGDATGDRETASETECKAESGVMAFGALSLNYGDRSPILQTLFGHLHMKGQAPAGTSQLCCDVATG
jgi:hypothetical protein